MGEVKPGYYQQSSTPLLAGNLVIDGGRVIDNFEIGEPPGVVRAYDAVTGTLVWAWDPGNPEVTREPLSPEGYTCGTPNVWVAASYDAELGMVYLPSPDLHGYVSVGKGGVQLADALRDRVTGLDFMAFAVRLAFSRH